MNDALVWARNLLSLAAIALTSGFTVVTAWQGGQGKFACFTIIITGASFLVTGSALDIFMIGMYAVICFGATVGIINAEEDAQ
ncbi:hypothetical protein RFF05_02915 [Bengtsoniella intestinalis]|uniref:hypothetical protein n=1 Tax=Bengtsoniella intestinalis TaxID=3073143 RepID=UPI00391F8D84